MAQPRKSKRNHQPSAASKSPSPSASGRLSVPLDDAGLRMLYAALLRARLVGARAAELFLLPAPDDPVRAAITVASAMDLLPGDLFFAPSSAHTAALARGVSPASLFAALRDRATAAGCGAPPLSSASELLYATGAAASLKVRGSSNLVTVLPAAVPANLKPWTVTLRLAANLRLPVIYVLQVPADHSSLAAAKLCAQADACGLPGITVDGHDAVAMLRVCQEARQKARQGYGPTLVECCCIPKSHAAPKSVHFHPAACDPLAAMQHYLERRNLWDEAWNGQISSRVAAEISVAEQALASPAPHDASPRPRPAPGTGPSPDETEQLALAEMAVFGR